MMRSNISSNSSWFSVFVSQMGPELAQPNTTAPEPVKE